MQKERKLDIADIHGNRHMEGKRKYTTLTGLRKGHTLGLVQHTGSLDLHNEDTSPFMGYWVTKSECYCAVR